MGRRTSLARRTLLAVLLVGALGGGTSGVYGAFFSTTSNPASSLSSKRIFPGDRHLTAWGLYDASGGGAEVNNSDLLAFDDARPYITASNWLAGHDAARYLDIDLASHLPAGVPAANVAFTFKVASRNAANNACYFFDVRETSSNTVLGTYGSSASPVACSAGTSYVTTTTAISEITTTSQANDLRIRVWGWTPGTNGTRTWNVDLAAITLTVFGAPLTISSPGITDVSGGGSGTAVNWGVAEAGDGAHYQSSLQFQAAFSTARYLRFVFPKSMPGSAKDVSVTLQHAYKADRNGTDNVCWYADILNGATVVQTVGAGGSPGNPVGCNNTNDFVTDSVDLTAVDTAEKVNNLVVKIYVRNSAARRTQHDLVRVRVSYTLDESGCADAGSVVVAPAADTYVRQDGASANTNYGTATTMFVQSTTGTAARRSLVRFPIPSTPVDCTLLDATLRAYQSATGGARTMTATRIAASWAETTVTWNTQPATTGSPVSASTGPAGSWISWTVLSLVESGAGDGFMLRDANESSGSISQTLHTRENANPAELVLTYG